MRSVVLEFSRRWVTYVAMLVGVTGYPPAASAQQGQVSAAETQKPRKTYSFTVVQCVEFAMLNQHKVLNLQLDEAGAQQQVRELLATGLPQVNASVAFQYNPLIQEAALPPEFKQAFGGRPIRIGVDYNLQPGLTVNQLVADGTYFIGLRAAREFVKLSRINTQASRVELAYTISKAYYAVLVNEKRLEILRTNLTTLEKSLNDTEKLQQNGLAQRIDVDRIQVSLNNLQTEIQKTEQLVDLSRYLLKFQMNMEQNAELTLTETIADTDFNPVFNALPEFADPTQRIEYSQLKQGMVLEEYNAKRLKAGYYPSLSAFFTFNFVGQSTKFDFFSNDEVWSKASSLGLQLRIPIFDGFRRDAQIQQSKIARKKLDNTLVNLEQAIDFEYRSARISLQNAIKSMEIQKRNMELAQRVFDNAQARYRQSVGTNLEVVQAETEKRQAQLNYFNALLDAYLAKVDVDKAIGKLYGSR